MLVEYSQEEHFEKSVATQIKIIFETNRSLRTNCSSFEKKIFPLIYIFYWIYKRETTKILCDI